MSEGSSISPDVTGPISKPQTEPRRIVRKPFGGRARKKQLLETREKLAITTTNLDEAEQRAEKAETESMRDHLTGLHNMKWFEEELRRRMAEATRQGRGLWVIYVDIDDFKGINDKHGHPVGDEVLKGFGEFGSREEEPIARIGGEEFAQVVTDGLDFQGVQRIVSRYSLNFKDKTRGILGIEATLSFGIARMQDGDTPETIRARADKALYYSKQEGKDKATLFEGDDVSGDLKNVPFLPKESIALAQHVSA